MTHREKSLSPVKTAGRIESAPHVRDRPLFLRRAAARAIVVTIAFILALNAPADAVWIGKNAANQTVTVDLKTAGPSHFSFLAIGTSANTINFGSGTFNGNIGDAHINTNPSLSGGTINGNIFLGNGINASNFVGNGTINGTVFTNQDSFLSQPVADANAAADLALTIKSTLSRTSITDSWIAAGATKTITGSTTAGATNVLKLSSINLTQGQTLILKAGAANQKFLLEVTGTFNLSNSSSIIVHTSNGLVPLDVLYALGAGTNLTATGTTSRASIIDGIILAKYGNINISYGQVNGEVIGACDLIFEQTSGGNAFSPIPEVSSFLPLLGLFSLATGGQFLMRRRSQSLAVA